MKSILFGRLARVLALALLVFSPLASSAQTPVAWAFDETGTVAPGTFVLFETTAPAGHTTGWRLRLDGHADADLYVRQGSAPTTASYLRRSLGQDVETITFLPNSITAEATYFVGVFLPADAPEAVNFRVTAEADWAQDLPWDAGLSDAGAPLAAPDTRGGDWCFRLVAQAPSGGPWRTRLTVTAGEADLYILSGTSLPTTTNNNARSERVGSDGLLRSALSNGQIYTLLVKASPGAEWSLVSGEAPVMALPEVAAVNPAAADGAANAPRTAFVMPPEGGRLFSVPVAAGPTVPAWRLWVYAEGEGGATTPLPEPILLRRNAVAFGGIRDHQEVGQMLVVPPYLSTTTETYYLFVSGEPATPGLYVDSRPQTITDLPFRSFTGHTDGPVAIDIPALAAGGQGYGYRTYRVQVPIDQLGWELTLVPTTGNPGGISVSRTGVPNAWFNDGFTERAANQSARLTIAPPILADGAWYVTIGGPAPWSGTLSSRPPEPPEIAFTDQNRTTADPSRPGWHYFVLNDLEAQLGSLGWELKLDAAVAGAELAVRSNAIPARWTYRNGYTASIQNRVYVDATTTSTLLQRAAQPVDVWYVGVYHPTLAVGAFELDASPILPTLLAAAEASHTVSNQVPGAWQYFRYDVGPDHLGWEVRLLEASSSGPEVVIRRGLLPPGGSNLAHGSASFPQGSTVSGVADLTNRSTSADGTRNWEGSDTLLLARGRPLEEGTYYVGVRNGGSVPASWTLRSRGFGPGLASAPTALAVDGQASFTDVAARDHRTVALDLPAGQRSWVLRVTPTRGEVAAYLAREALPGTDVSIFNALSSSSPSSTVPFYKLGEEVLVLMPPNGSDFLLTGRYYLTVVSEGEGPTGARLGTGSVDFTVRSEGPIEVIDLGEIAAGVDLTESGSYGSGGVRAYRFTLPANLNGLEIKAENVVGDPSINMSLATGDRLPSAGGGSYRYFASAGTSAIASDPAQIVRSSPAAGTYHLVVGHSSSHYAMTQPGDRALPAATFTLRVTGLGEEVLPFAGGLISVADQPAGTWRYFRVTVPELGPTAAPVLGWEVRLLGVSGTNMELHVRRDLPPPGANMGYSGTTWASGNSVMGTSDLTQRSTSTDGTRLWDGSHALLLAMGRPLQPGLYYVGVRNGSSAPRSWTLRSRGLGVGLDIEPVVIDFFDGEVTFTDLAPRDFRLVAVDVPAEQRSWNFRAVPSRGEALVMVAAGALPGSDMSIFNSPSHTLPGPTLPFFKAGAEEGLILPPSFSDFLPVGRHYLAVFSEGENPAGARIGTGSVEVTLTSNGNLPVTDLGTLAVGADLTLDDGYAGGEVRAYRFELPAGILALELALENKTGDAEAELYGLDGQRLPGIGGSYNYAPRGGAFATLQSGTLATRSNPVAGEYRVVVGSRDSHFAQANPADRPGDAATYRLRVSAIGETPLPFNDGVASLANQPVGSWRYYRVEVPATTPTGAPVLGWDLRLTGAVTGSMTVVARRDLVPPGGSNIGAGGTTWPSGSQYTLGIDLTDRAASFDGSNSWEGAYSALLPMGRPLQPGSYVVGVRNNHTAPVSWSLTSRGVGEGLALAPVPVAFADGEATWPDLPPRGLALYAIDVPAGQRSWTVEAAFTRGEGRLYVAGGSIPGMDRSVFNSPGAVLPTPTLVWYQAGNEIGTILPTHGQDLLPAGRYYALVVAEGENLTLSRIGDGSVAGSFRSRGPLVAGDGGLLASGQSVTFDRALASGAVAAFAVATTPDVLLLEARLTERSGPGLLGLSWRAGERLPSASGSYRYAPVGGSSPEVTGADLAVRVNPPAGLHRLLVGPTLAHYAQSNPSTRAVGESAFTLQVRAVAPVALAFDPAVATAELPSARSGDLVDSQRALHVIDVPETLGDEPILGLLLRLETSQGAASLRVHYDYAAINAGASMAAGWRLLAPPFLRPGRWYVEVTGTGATSYTLSSRVAALARDAWALPAAGIAAAGPGLTGNTIGDSGVTSAGAPLPGDQGVDIGATEMHFYAVDVDPANAGLLRLELVALNGNPDLYLQVGRLPSADHAAGPTNWNGANAFERRMTGTGTEIANFVPLDGRFTHALPAGRHYLAVRGTGSNGRYRLRVAAGNELGAEVPVNQRNVQALPTNGTLLDGQTLAAGDWRYYRVPIPAEPTTTLRVTFSEAAGDVRLHVRHGAPPGLSTSTSTSIPSDIIDWIDDNENVRPLPGPFDVPGVVDLPVPSLRPGEVIVLGFEGKTAATFSVGAEWVGPSTLVAFAPFTLLPYNGGAQEIVLPPLGQATWRVFVPPEATRWKHTSIHPNDVWTYLEQGAPSPQTTSGHRAQQSQANTGFSQFLGAWPWVANHTWYLTAVNKSNEARTFSFHLDGRDATNDDEDNDGLLDAWERLYFGNTNATAGADTDGDGLTNLREFTDGTVPTDSASARYTLALSGRAATPAVLPAGTAHDRFTPLELMAEPAEAANSVRWWRFLDNPLDRSSVGRLAGRVSGQVLIPAAGDWTFLIRSTVGYSLRVGGVERLTRDSSGGTSEALVTLPLASGPVDLELILASNSGTDAVEIGAAAGPLAAWDPTAFRALGDLAGGGLAVTTPTGSPGLAVEVREPMINSTVTRANASDLLAGLLPVRWRAAGVVPTADLVDRASFTGRFDGGWPYPRVIAGTTVDLASEGDTAVEAVAGLDVATTLGAFGGTLVPVGYVPWLGEGDATAPGGVAVRSGWVDGLGRSELRFRATGRGTLRFSWRLAATNTATTLVLERRTDGGAPVTVATRNTTMPWTELLFALPAGEHDLRFHFRRSGEAGAVEDHGAVAGLVWQEDPSLAEALDAPHLAWVTSGNVGWLGTREVNFDGEDAARSGVIGANQQSVLTTTVTGPGTLTFRWRVSSEANRDFLGFRVNDSELAAISGTVDWEQRTFEIPAGAHTLAWRYAKDGSTNSGSDAGWVDTVTWMPEDAYALWLAGFGLAGDAGLPGADPDEDGVPNLAEYAFGLDPLTPDRRGLADGGLFGLPRAIAEDAGGGVARLVVEYVVRRDPLLTLTTRFGDRPGAASEAGTAVVVETISDLDRVQVRDPSPGGANRSAEVELSR